MMGYWCTARDQQGRGREGEEREGGEREREGGGGTLRENVCTYSLYVGFSNGVCHCYFCSLCNAAVYN